MEPLLKSLFWSVSPSYIASLCGHHVPRCFYDPCRGSSLGFWQMRSCHYITRIYANSSQGPNGGPREDRVTGLLVRSTSTDWNPASLIAVDGGTLLAGIIRLLKKDIEGAKNRVMQDGPFAGLRLPFESAEANGAHVFREIIDAVLITHPHLDHISGLAINTPIVEAGNGPKSVAALPSVIAAIKNHMFNDVIWPNLSDEDGGAGLLTYNRLVEGGNPRFGAGDFRGYVRACTGILTKCLTVSHGKCKQRYHAESAMHHRINSTVFASHPPEHYMMSSRAMSIDPTEAR